MAAASKRKKPNKSTDSENESALTFKKDTLFMFSQKDKVHDWWNILERGQLKNFLHCKINVDDFKNMLRFGLLVDLIEAHNNQRDHHDSNLSVENISVAPKKQPDHTSNVKELNKILNALIGPSISTLEDLTLLRTHIYHPPINVEISSRLLNNTNTLTQLISKYKDVCYRLLSGNTNPEITTQKDAYLQLWQKKKFVGIISDATLGPHVELFKQIIRLKFELDDNNPYGQKGQKGKKEQLTELDIVEFCLKNNIIIIYIIYTQFTFADSAKLQSYFPQLSVYKFLVSHIASIPLDRPVYIDDIPENQRLQCYYESDYNYFTKNAPYNLRIRYRPSFAGGVIIPFDECGIFKYCIEEINPANPKEFIPIMCMEFGVGVLNNTHSGPPLSELALSYIHLHLFRHSKDFLNSHPQLRDAKFTNKQILCNNNSTKVVSFSTLHEYEKPSIEQPAAKKLLEAVHHEVLATTHSLMGLTGNGHLGSTEHLAYNPNKPDKFWMLPGFENLVPQVLPDIKAEADLAQARSVRDIKDLAIFSRPRMISKNMQSVDEQILYIKTELGDLLYETYIADPTKIGKHLHFLHVLFSTIDKMAAACAYDQYDVLTLWHHASTIEGYIIQETYIDEAAPAATVRRTKAKLPAKSAAKPAAVAAKADMEDSNNQNFSVEFDEVDNDDDSNLNSEVPMNNNEANGLQNDQRKKLKDLVPKKYAAIKKIIAAYSEIHPYSITASPKSVDELVTSDIVTGFESSSDWSLMAALQQIMSRAYSKFFGNPQKGGELSPPPKVTLSPPPTNLNNNKKPLHMPKQNTEEFIAQLISDNLFNVFGPFSETNVINQCGDAVRYLNRYYITVKDKHINDPLHKEVLYSIYDDFESMLKDHKFSLPQILYKYKQYPHQIKSRYIQKFMDIFRKIYMIKTQSMKHITRKSKNKAVFYGLLRKLSEIYDFYYGSSSFNNKLFTISKSRKTVKATTKPPVQNQLSQVLGQPPKKNIPRARARPGLGPRLGLGPGLGPRTARHAFPREIAGGTRKK